MEDMDTTSFTLFDGQQQQLLSTVHESDEMSPHLLTLRQRLKIAQFCTDEVRDVECGFSMDHQDVMSPSFYHSKPLNMGEDEALSGFGREGRQSKRVAFTSCKSRMSAVKKRSKLCFLEKTSEATPSPPPLGSGKQVRKTLFHSSDNTDDRSIVTMSDPLRNRRQFGSIVDASSHCHPSNLQSTTEASFVPWKKHSSLPNPPIRCQFTEATFPRCHSDAGLCTTKSALSGSSDDHDLIGDYSRPFRLPLLTTGKHPDLKAISHETMATVLSGEYVDEFIVVDCRYPYEYEAGHIKGARNIYSKDDLFSQFLSSPPPSSAEVLQQKSPILIFHCEFSSERGPKLLRYLRNRDRSIHRENYPALYYPEVYLLEGGYKEFCQWHLDLCEPNGYKAMVDKNHTSELTYYRSKSRLYTSKLPQPSTNNSEGMENQKFTSIRC